MSNKREFDLVRRSISHEVDSSKVKKIDQNGKKTIWQCLWWVEPRQYTIKKVLVPLGSKDGSF